MTVRRSKAGSGGLNMLHISFWRYLHGAQVKIEMSLYFYLFNCIQMIDSLRKEFNKRVEKPQLTVGLRYYPMTYWAGREGP
jgi:hypothetical protein